jgi:acyl-CoA synthetase (AMP-forming)/AMP-acid ligase II
VLAIVDPSSHRDAVAIAQRVPLRHGCCSIRAKDGFSSFEARWQSRCAGRAASDRDDTQAFQPTRRVDRPPKGAIMTHRGMLWYVATTSATGRPRRATAGSWRCRSFHKNALRGTVKPMLYAGGSFVLMPGYEPRAYLEALAKYKCTYSRGVARCSRCFLQYRDLLKTLDLTSLRSMTIGSAVVTPELLELVTGAAAHQGRGKLWIDRGWQPAASAD